MKQEQQLKQLFKFIKLLPEEFLIDCINYIDLPNRNERRKFEKLKTTNDKIDFILRDTNNRVELIKNLYSKYSNAVDLDDNSTYQDILASINGINCIPYVLYMLYRCCEENFDNEHFSDFIRSEQFQKTIKNEWESLHIGSVNLMDMISGTTSEEDKKMIYYLGSIECRSTFYNFKPQYIYNSENKTIEEILYVRDTFPMFGSLNLAYERYTKSHDFLKSLDVDKAEEDAETTPIKNIYAISFSEEELEDSGNDKIAKKLNLQMVCDSGEDLANRIQPISKFEMYKIATPKGVVNNESFSGMIFIERKEAYNTNEKVLIEYNSKLFGPYILQERSIDGEKYVRPDSGSQKYVLEYYDDGDYVFIAFEKKETYMQDPMYTDIAYIKNPPHSMDVISDVLLLEKMKDNIDVGLMNSNPEEFERLYSTSPFLASIPGEIRNGRIDRIQHILRNTIDYDEIKKKALNSLIDSLDYELLSNKIKNSELYKDLQKDIVDLQKEKEELHSKNNSLEEANKKLNFEIDQLKEQNNSANNDVVSTEEIEKLNNENSELKEKLLFVEEYELLKKKHSDLKSAYSDLQSKYDSKKALYDSKVREIDEKDKELEGIKSKVQEFITNELNKTDAARMLRTAFDPYISNAMIEAAGSYRVEAESDQYKIVSKEMKDFKYDEKYSKNDLINMLVEGVQKFRKYSKNEILNMYICLSQNFLTVFSGEPGTGKTSMCNILASSLGLNNFGGNGNISKNRYVPVSVERGWSSKRDLIGYFNPLTKKYDRSNAKIYDGLMILNEERKDSRFPYLILLDEANLSPMEYYWADFMRAADSTESDIFINIGLDKDIYIPKTLHFLATINNDQTTEQLSPRLIDRAWIVKLPKTSVIETTIKVDDFFKDVILWSDVERTFVLSEVKEMSLKNLAEQIYKLFDEHHLFVSPRVQQSIKNYVCVAQEIMEDEIGVCNKKEKALDFAIVQKLLPKINGYYKDYERLFASLTQICDENHLRMTKEALIFMEEFQRQNMGYCQYLI